MITNDPTEARRGTAGQKALVQCVGVTKHFGGVQALQAVSLELHAGEVVALVGENGAGKSTLVKILSGLHQPDQGEIWLGEKKVENLSPHRAREFGVLLAVALLGVINSGLVSLGIDPHYTDVVKGAALILAVTLDQLSQERREHYRKWLAMRERHRA